MHSHRVQIKFDWSEYLNLAENLAGQADNLISEETKLRCSISRAYYAAFCKARNYLRDIEGVSIPQSGKSHKIVIDNFKKSTDKTRKKIGINLDRLRIDRNKADYDDIVEGLLSMTKVDLKLAQNVISEIRLIRKP